MAQYANNPIIKTTSGVPMVCVMDRTKPNKVRDNQGCCTITIVVAPVIQESLSDKCHQQTRQLNGKEENGKWPRRVTDSLTIARTVIHKKRKYALIKTEH
jgi:hypothetical protein